jgi:hypothetical protein
MLHCNLHPDLSHLVIELYSDEMTANFVIAIFLLGPIFCKIFCGFQLDNEMKDFRIYIIHPFFFLSSQLLATLMKRIEFPPHRVAEVTSVRHHHYC